MDTRQKFKIMLTNMLSIFAILAIAFPTTSSASAQEPIPHFYASTAHDGIWGADFVAEAQLTFSIYDAAGGNLLWSGDKAADSSGQVWLGGEDHLVDLVPGYQVVILMDGIPIKDLVLEEITVDLFDVGQGLLQGTAPAGRTVWVGVDFENTHLGMEVTANAETGVWMADFDIPVPANYTWAGAQLFDDDGDAIEANPPRPAITISTSNNYLRADGFVPNTTLTFTVYATQDPGEDSLWSDSRLTDGNGFAIIWPWEQPLDLVTGNSVVATDGINEKQLVLEAVTLDVFDPNIDFLAGAAPTAPEGRYVWVWAGSGSNGCGMGVTADPLSGEWTADLSTQSCDITYDMEGAAHVYDEDGDVTVYHKGPPPPPPSPWLIAFPENDAVEGWEWPEGATVTLTINNAPGLEWSGNAQVTPWGDPRTYLRIEFGDQYDLQIGDTVTLTGEDGATRIHTVQNLSVTNVNGEADTVSGTANPGAVIQVWPHGQDYLVEDIAEDGTWFADFGALGFHTIEETGGRSQIVIDGNATAVDWNVPPSPPNPFIAVSLTQHWFMADHFLPETLVTFTVYGAQGSDTSVLELSRYTDTAGFLITEGWEHNWDLEPGNFVVATDGVTTKELLLEYVTLDETDPEADLVSGMAVPGREVAVGAGNADGEQWMSVFADEISGVWVADFTQVGFDITEDIWAGGHVGDEDGDVTAAHNSGPPAPPMFIWADPLCECISGWDWRVGDPITLQVFDQNGDELQLQNPTQVYTAESGVAFELGGEGIDLQPGYRITMSNGLITKELIISRLTVKEMNPVANTISGVRDPDLALFVHSGGQEPLNYDFNGDQWVAAFESLPLDGFGEAYQPDDDGDKTGMGWDGVPNFIRSDIFALDPQGMNIQRVSRLDGTGEYNPSWSPNGKKIAHDVVYWDGSHGIYITDVSTGVSVPLVGAEDGGNDAVWSPNAKWIAFDRHWVGDSNLYIVSDSGGSRTLVRGNAISADWAPNGKRLVFQDLDGSIRTVAVDGGKGDETFIAESGTNPAWSPDGNWIAYADAGDIWKVQVNVQGTPFGEPVRLTSGPLTDDQPSWSADSQTVVFQSGMTEDYDLWSVSATGGDPTWINGAPVFGDYDPDYSFSGQHIAYSSLSPDGQAAREWIAVYKLDQPAGTWLRGEHSYYLGDNWGHEGEPVSFAVSEDVPVYDGYALLRGAALWANDGDQCVNISVIHPDQKTRFHSGWLTSGSMMYEQALEYFSSLSPWIVRDEGEPLNFPLYQIAPYSPDTWQEYFCTFTE